MLPTPPEFILPDYDGGTIANVPATIANWLEVPFDGLPPLRPELAGRFAPVKHVVRIIIDGLGWNLISALQKMQPEFFSQATHIGKITSIFPSTTTAALSSLWTGLAAAQHGLVGMRILFPEIGTLGQMINLSPTLTGEPEMLVAAGVNMETFLPGKGLGEQFAAAGVQSYALKGRNIVNSPLSQMHGRGLTKQFGIFTVADMFVQVRELLIAKADERLFISGYWPAVDTLSHIYGPFGAHVIAEAAAVIQQLDTLLLTPLRQDGRVDTLVCVLADHGQTETPMPDKLVIVDDHEVLRQGLLMIPAGDSRCSYLYTRHGRQAEVLDYLNSELAHALVAWPADEVLAHGLLGPRPHASQAAHRTGDIVVAMRDGYAITHAGAGKVTRSMSGRHGSLTTDEMEVPFMVFSM